MQKSFSFKGITLNGDNMLAGDGECIELVNLRCRDGCLLPIPVPGDEKELESVYIKFYWHSVAEMFLGIESSDERAVHFYDKELNIVKKEENGDSLALFPQLHGVARIEFMGNIACCITDKTIYHLIFDAGNYKWLGERPELPNLTFLSDSLVYSVKSDEKYLVIPPVGDSDNELYWGNASKGFFDECLAGLHSKGYYVDRALFRFAFRLFDGSYLYYSPIYYVVDNNSVSGLSRDGGNFVSTPVNNVDQTEFQAKIQGFIPTFQFTNLNLTEWENIIVAIDVFTSGSIYGHKVSKTDEKWSRRDGVYYSDVRGKERYVKKSNKELLADVTDAASFYKVAEFNIKGVLMDSVKDVSLSSLALCDNLPDEECAAMSRSATNTYVFNGRLHLAGVREELFKAYNPYDYLPSMLDAHFADYAMVVTKIKTSKGIAVVKKEYNGTFALGVKDGVYCITPYIMYPDSRAYEMMFVIVIDSVVYSKNFYLKQHKLLNIASYIQSYGDGATVTLVSGLSNGTEPNLLSAENVKAFFSYTPGEYVIVFSEGDGWYYGDVAFSPRNSGSGYHPLISCLNPVEGDTITIIISKGNELENLLDINDIEINATWEVLSAVPQIEEVNACEMRNNVMKVSKTDNPFHFPVKNTYTPSYDDILAVCSNTVALSQGQFGQHPLYVFCKDGIWVMTNDSSGNIAYTTAQPLSREVCVNTESLCGIDSGVVFVSKGGLMLLQGGNLVCLSAVLHNDSKYINDTSQNSLLFKIAQLSYNGSILCANHLFREYIKTAVVGYLANEKELLVSNSRYDFSYVFSLENSSWTKVNKSYACFINRYPIIMGNTLVDDKSFISVLHKDYAAGYAPVLLITRPQPWGSKMPKRIVQFMLHATVKATQEHKPYEYGGLGCYLLCSNDGVHFKLLGGVEKTDDFSDVVFPFFPTQSYRYYMIALSGTMSVESKIVGVQLAIECVWDNRLR